MFQQKQALVEIFFEVAFKNDAVFTVELVQ
jgi:hypothetical protein